MDWEKIEISPTIRINSLPQSVDQAALEEFLSPFVSRINRIDKKASHAYLSLENSEDINSILKLNGRMLHGSCIEIHKIADDEQFSEPELLEEESPEDLADLIKIEKLEKTDANPLPVPESCDFNQFLHEIQVKPRKALPPTDSFSFVLKYRLPITALSLIFLTILSFT